MGILSINILKIFRHLKKSLLKKLLYEPSALETLKELRKN